MKGNNKRGEKKGVLKGGAGLKKKKEKGKKGKLKGSIILRSGF